MKLPNIILRVGQILLLLSIGKAWAAEDHLYDFRWLDPDKKVYVLQNKIYEKRGSAYANLGFLSGLSSRYQDVYGGRFAAGYYLFEEWAIEAFYHYYSNEDNTNREILEGAYGAYPFVRSFKNKWGVMLLWSPFYGKINTLNKIIYFDWFGGVGTGKISSKSNIQHIGTDLVNQDNPIKRESFSALMFKMALRVYLTKRYHVGVEYHRDIYRIEGPTLNEEDHDPDDPPPPTTVPKKEQRFHSELTFLVGMSF